MNLAVVDRLTQNVAAPSEVGARQLALKDRILQVIAEAPQRLVDAVPPLVVRDVVADQKGVPQTPGIGPMPARLQPNRCTAMSLAAEA